MIITHVVSTTLGRASDGINGFLAGQLGQFQQGALRIVVKRLAEIDQTQYDIVDMADQAEQVANLVFQSGQQSLDEFIAVDQYALDLCSR